MSTAACFPYKGEEVWLLANATVYEAREVATEFNEKAARLWDEFFRALIFAGIVVFRLMPSLRRLSSKQQKLIVKLEAADHTSWSLEDCREMSDLLHDLVLDEGNFVKNGFGYFNVVPPAVKILHELEVQLRRIDAISLRLDALAVKQIKSPGHDECLQFLALASEPEEFDFSTEPDRKKILSIA